MKKMVINKDSCTGLENRIFFPKALFWKHKKNIHGSKSTTILATTRQKKIRGGNLKKKDFKKK